MYSENFKENIEIRRKDGSYLLAKDDVFVKDIEGFLKKYGCDEFLASGFLDKYSPNDTFSVIDLILVKRQKQGRGIGSKMMNKYFEKANNDRHILIADSISDERVLEFYKKHGYQVMSNDYYPVLIKQ